MLAQCGETVRMEFADASAPAVFRSVGDDSRLFVLMPVRV
jgi:DNA polymerase III sliding clamp (beta) subunit (PCNA family)